MKHSFFDNTSTALRKGGKQHSFVFYLDKIKELDMDRVFSKLEAYCTDGDIHPPYPYQWKATSTIIAGDDDSFEGIDSTPLGALRNLYKEMKHFKENPPEEEGGIDN